SPTSPDGQNIPAAAGAQPGQDIPAAPEHRPEAPAAASHSGPATYRAPGAYPAPGAQPAYAPQSAPGHPASSPGLQPPHAGWPAPGPQASTSGHPTNPGHSNHGYSAPGPHNPAHPAAAPRRPPGTRAVSGDGESSAASAEEATHRTGRLCPGHRITPAEPG